MRDDIYIVVGAPEDFEPDFFCKYFVEEVVYNARTRYGLYFEGKVLGRVYEYGFFESQLEL